MPSVFWVVGSSCRASSGCDPPTLCRVLDGALGCSGVLLGPPWLPSTAGVLSLPRVELSSCLLSPTSQPSLPDSFQTSSFVLGPMSPLTQKLDFLNVCSVTWLFFLSFLALLFNNVYRKAGRIQLYQSCWLIVLPLLLGFLLFSVSPAFISDLAISPLKTEYCLCSVFVQHGAQWSPQLWPRFPVPQW